MGTTQTPQAPEANIFFTKVFYHRLLLHSLIIPRMITIYSIYNKGLFLSNRNDMYYFTNIVIKIKIRKIYSLLKLCINISVRIGIALLQTPSSIQFSVQNSSFETISSWKTGSNSCWDKLTN